MKRTAGLPARLWALVSCLLAVAAVHAAAEQGPARAILLRGPRAVKEIPFLPPNLLPALRADYSLGGEQVSVLFSAETLVLPREWRSLRCGALRLAEVPVDSGFTVCLAESAGGPLFMFFSFPRSGGDWCLFVTAFRERFLYLRGYRGAEDEVPFPAVLELGR
jgi:hypothetical protein